MTCHRLEGEASPAFRRAVTESIRTQFTKTIEDTRTDFINVHPQYTNGLQDTRLQSSPINDLPPFPLQHYGVDPIPRDIASCKPGYMHQTHPGFPQNQIHTQANIAPRKETNMREEHELQSSRDSEVTQPSDIEAAILIKKGMQLIEKAKDSLRSRYDLQSLLAYLDKAEKCFARGFRIQRIRDEKVEDTCLSLTHSLHGLGKYAAWSEFHIDSEFKALQIKINHLEAENHIQKDTIEGLREEVTRLLDDDRVKSQRIHELEVSLLDRSKIRPWDTTTVFIPPTSVRGTENDQDRVQRPKRRYMTEEEAAARSVQQTNERSRELVSLLTMRDGGIPPSTNTSEDSYMINSRRKQHREVDEPTKKRRKD